MGIKLHLAKENVQGVKVLKESTFSLKDLLSRRGAMEAFVADFVVIKFKMRSD